MLKFKLTANEFDELEDAFKAHYKQDGSGNYLLDTDDDSRDRLKEFRTNNIQLQQKVQELEGTVNQYKDIDPKKARAALEELEQLKDKQLIDEGKVDELLANRTERMRQDFEGRLAAVTQDRDKFKELADKRFNTIRTTSVDSRIAEVVTNIGVPAKGALADIKRRAHETWTVDEDGNLIAMEGDKVKYGADGSNPLTMEEWAESLKQDAPHLFEGSSGGGANNQDRGDSGSQSKGTIGRNQIGSNLEDVAAGKVNVVS